MATYPLNEIGGKMIEIGRLAVKTAGRDAGLKCVVVDILDDKFVLIDGETRRRKCNILHLEPLKEVIKINKNAPHEAIKKEFEKLGLKTRETKPKQKTERPRRKRKTPEQLRQQKEEKTKLVDLFRKKKEAKEKVVEKSAEKETLEEKAGLEEKKEESKEQKKKIAKKAEA